MTVYNNNPDECKKFIQDLADLIKDSDFEIDFTTGFLYFKSNYVGILEEEEGKIHLIDDSPYDGLSELYTSK